MEHIPNQSLDPGIYLKRFSSENPILQQPVANHTGIIIVIPCYAELQLGKTLSSLLNCKKPSCASEVIVVVNDHDRSSEEEVRINDETVALLNKSYTNQYYENLSFHLIPLRNLPFKAAGVGKARKTGMDEAVRRFSRINKNGVIVCLDADCTVAENYLTAIEHHFFASNLHINGADLYFEHPLSSNALPLNKGIELYELHLRYYVHCQRFIGCPYAFHTVGSSMAVTSEAYQKQGGMNTRKAGEDFYFLHKIIALGSFKSLTGTTVYPSARTSNRVPFGTGKAQTDFLATKEQLTYSFEIMKKIKVFTESFESYYTSSSIPSFDPHLQEWLEANHFLKKVEEIRKNTSQPSTFTKRMWQWFNAFQLMKLIHFMRDRAYANQPVTSEATTLLNTYYKISSARTANELLLQYRELDKKRQSN